MNKKTIMAFVIMLVLAIAIIIGFYSLNQYANTAPEQVTDTSELGKLLKKDLEADYPATPREVVKFYNRINSAMYNEAISDANFEKLLEQMRLLFAEELLAENSYENQLEAFRQEKANYEAEKKSIVNYSIPENSAVEYYVNEGQEMAELEVGYMLKEAGDYSKMSELFILKQDESDKWKIIGWKINESE